MLTFFAFLIFFAASFVLVSFWRKLKATNKHRGIMIILGKGGHTAEMLYLAKNYDFTKFERVYVLFAKEDELSRPKMETYISSGKLNIDKDKIVWMKCFQSRKNKEGAISSIKTILKSMIENFLVFLKNEERIDVIVSNGAGIGLCAIFPYFLLSILGVKNFAQIIFIESFCRTRNLSMTGLILYYTRICDNFLVMWPKLSSKYPRTEYYGLVI